MSRASKRLITLTFDKKQFDTLKPIFIEAEKAESAARNQRQRTKEPEES